MTKVEVELHEDVVSIINKIKNINDTGIELHVPDGAVIFENILNLKILMNWSDREGKVLSFLTEDLNGQNLLMAIEEDETPNLNEDNESEDPFEELEKQVPKKKITMPKFSFRLPKLQAGGRGFIILGVVVAALVVGGFFGFKHVQQLPVATIKILVNSQPLARSIQIKVSGTGDTSVESKVLKGETISAAIDEKLAIPTTGEKIIGEKAKGEITIYNKTDEEKKFKEGTEVIFEDDDLRVKYELVEDVTVPPREEAPDSTPVEPKYISGQADVDVEAQEIGKNYNIDEGESLEVEDQKKSEFEAVAKKDIDGGKEETIKTVAQEDLDKLLTDLTENSEEKVLKALEDAVGKDQKFINGSEYIETTNTTYSNELGEEAEEVELQQTISAKGLVYNPNALNDLIDELVEDFVPEGFVLSTKERSVNVEVLGNTETTSVSTGEADLQVTLKTFVIPEISEDSVKEQLFGKSVSEAQKIIGSIRNIKTYEFNLSPRIPFMDYVPKDPTRIDIEIERE